MNVFELRDRLVGDYASYTRLMLAAWPALVILACHGVTIWAAAGVLRRWIEEYGVPLALYTDWKNVYVRLATEKER